MENLVKCVVGFFVMLWAKNQMLKWEGYEFLDNARECQVWQAAKKAAGNLSWSVFTKVLTEIATEYAKQFLNS
jgi:hypothetical protein